MFTQILSAESTATFAGLFIPMDQLGDYVVSSLIFSAIGIILFALAYYVIFKASPFSIR